MKGTPDYWKQFLYEALTTVKQLSAPTFFDIVMCRYEWDELPFKINKLSNQGLSYKDHCNYLNNNLVFLARHVRC